MNLRVLFSMVGIQAMGAILSFVSVIALTAALGTENYGKYAWIVSIGSVGSLLIQRGLPTTIVKRFSPISLPQIKSPSPLANTLLLYVAVSAGALVVTVPLAVVATSHGPGAVVWALPIAGAMASFTVSDAILRSARRGELSQIAGQILRPGLLLAGTLGLQYSGRTDATPYLALHAVTFLVATVVFLLPVLTLALSGWRGGGLVRSNSAHFHVAISRNVGEYLPVFITGFFVPPETLAYLAIAIRLTGPTRFGLNAARAHFGARINGAIQDKDFDRVRAEYAVAARFSAATAALLAVGVLALVSYLATRQQGPFSAYDPNLLIMVLAITSLSHIVFTLFGPAQLVGILLGHDLFVRNLNVAFLFLLATGLLLAALSQQILASAMVMVLYSLGVSGGIAWKIRTNLKTLKSE